MEISSTPRAKFSRRKFSSPSISSPYRSPLIHSLPEKKVQPSDDRISIAELKASAIELWRKNKVLEEKIKILQEKKDAKGGLKKEKHKAVNRDSYMKELHEYNNLKDIASTVMEKIAIIDQVTLRTVYERFGVSEKD